MSATLGDRQNVGGLAKPGSDAAECGPRRPRLIHAVILLFTAGLSSLATAVLGPILPRMQEHFAATPHADYLVPLSLTVPMLMMAALSVFAGMLADRFGRKPILVCAAVGYAICGTAPLWLESLNAILASRVLLGVAEAAVMTISTTLIGDYFEGNRRTKMMSLHTTFAAISAFALNIVGGILGSRGWRTPYSVYGVSLLLSVLMAAYLWEPEVGRRAASSARIATDDSPLRVRQLLVICATAALVGLTFLTVPVHLGYLYALIHETSSEHIGFAYALNSVGVILGSLTFGWLVGPRLKSVRLQLTLAAAVLGLSFLGMSLSMDYASLTVAAAVNGIGMGMLLPTVVTWNMREVPPSRRGVGVGAFQSSLFLGMFLNPIVVVSLDKWSGSRATSVGWMGFALLFPCCLAVALAVREKYSAAMRSSLDA